MSARYTVWGRVAPAALVILIAGCAPPRDAARPGAEAAAPAAAPVAQADGGNAGEQALAPETFDKTGLTIWDGGATLQGIWVAHPLAERAQRVQVINLDNGRIVQGAMFRRDPTISGPSILVSSDAAAALALQPGRPTQLRLTALKQGVYVSPPPPPEAAPATVDAAPQSNAAASEVETAALAAPESAATPPTEASEGAEQAGAAQPEASAAANDEPAPPPAPFARSDDAQAQPAAAPAEAEAAPEALETNVTETAVAPLPAEEVEVAAAQPAPAPEPAPAPKKISAASVSPYQGDLPKGRYVQAGAFGVEYNARALVANMRGRGHPANYVIRSVGGNMLNVVMIGPFASEAEADAAKAEAIAAGAAGARKVTR